MIGKLFLPIAIGGGLLALLASSAKAEPAPRNPFDVLPANLRILAAQAQGTNDPAMLEQTADQLEMQGFVQAAGVLRTQADQIRRIRAGATPANPFDALPSNLRILAAQAQGTNDPGALEQTADQLEKHGFVQAAGVLRTQADHARRTRAGTAPPPAPTITAAAVPSTPPTSTTPPFVPDSDKKAPQLTPELQKMIADAIANGTAPVLTSTAFVLERAGLGEVAEDLRRRAREAASKTAPPAQKDLPNVALDPSMPADLALEVARQLQLQGDPAALETLARELRLRGFSNTADQVEAKAKQIRAMLDAARTMNDIDREFKSPGQPQPPASQTPTQQLPPVTVTATPPTPVVVPATPVPQPQPPERSKVQILADAVSTSLNNLIEQYGSVPKARFKEDQGLVQRFQTEERLTTDGKYGPTTAAHVARYASDVPPPFYWRKGAGQKDLGTYRSNLEAIALDAEQLGNHDRAARLRASAAKASLA
ncbi:MAG TPA: hypothetical protein VJN18_01925 [Polyangiaceae bacterium]|nr:hypothetical protein [Polyangiaceae bacterium]